MVNWSTSSSPYPLATPPSSSDSVMESDVHATEELRLLKAQMEDITCVCDAIAHTNIPRQLSKKPRPPLLKHSTVVSFQSYPPGLGPNRPISHITIPFERITVLPSLPGTIKTNHLERTPVPLDHHIRCSQITMDGILAFEEFDDLYDTGVNPSADG